MKEREHFRWSHRCKVRIQSAGFSVSFWGSSHILAIARGLVNVWRLAGVMVVWRPLIVSQAWLILENHMQILLQSAIPPQIIVNYWREGGEPRVL